MRSGPLHFKRYATLSVAVAFFVCLGVPARAQSVQDHDNKPVQDNDATPRPLVQFDRFLDTHHEIAEQLRQKPWLATNYEFLQAHPDLNTFLQDHPALRQQIAQNPTAFVQQDQRFDQRGYRNDLAAYDRFLDGHREIAEQVRAKPWLAADTQFVQQHPELKTFLQDHPDLRASIEKNPGNVASDEQAFEGAGNARERNTNRSDAAQFDRFLDGHREIAEQVKRNPSLLDDRKFVDSHPALQRFLQSNPGVSEEVKENPNAFMRQENRFDRSENAGDRDAAHEHMADFGGFLNHHPDIARDMSDNPDRAADKQYVENHAELNSYLKAHPEVRQDLMANPQTFVKGAQQFSTDGSAVGTTTGSGAAGSTTTGGTSVNGGGSSGTTTTTPTPKPEDHKTKQ